MRNSTLSLLSITFLLASSGYCQTPSRLDSLPTVQQAISASLRGDKQQYRKLLSSILARAPNDKLAQSYLGSVEVDGQWLEPAVVASQAAGSKNLQTYLTARNRTADSLAGHVELARLCKRLSLPEYEKYHWAMVFYIQPGNKLAIRRLQLKLVDGKWFTPELLARHKDWKDRVEAAERKMQPWIRQLLAAKTAEDEARIAAELKQHFNPLAIAHLERELTLRSDHYASICVEILSEDESLPSTMSLVRHAFLSRATDVRQKAIEALSKRPLYTFVPFVIGQLQVPFQARVFHSWTEGDTYEFIVEAIREDSMGVSIYPTYLTYQGVPRGLRDTLAEIAVSTERLAAEHARTNSLATEILTQTTAEDFGDSPHDWADWWRERNGDYLPRDVPIRYERVRRAYRFRYPPRPMDCFLRGTPVVTDRGLISIEQLRRGDRVLSQSASTGALEYQFIVSTSRRPPGEMVRLGIDGRDIVCTKGHPVWVIGKGWTLAQDVSPSDYVQTATGPQPVQHVEPGPTDTAYNLVVDNFQSYFVGEKQLLVHDSTGRNANEMLAPGIPNR